MNDLLVLSATELARRLRSKDLSAREVLGAHLQQIERVNPKVNAIVTLVADRARRQAAHADERAAHGEFLGVLHGLPVAHKDLEDTQGIRTTYGSPIFRDHIPDQDSPIVERIKQAGAITIGKTNTPEFGAGSQTFNPVFGATRNPYDLSKTCGGSSGGAAVALACRMVAIADGSDMGGSLRNPASFCSVVGLRPSSTELNITGPMARSVEDLALLLSAIAPSSGLQPLDRNPRGTRIAWCANLLGLPFDRRVTEVFEAQRKIFETLGCSVADAEPDFTDADDIFKVLRAAAFHQQHAAKVALHRDLIKTTVVEEVERGERLSAADIAQAGRKKSRLLRRVAQFMEQFDFFVLPTVQVPPFDVNQPFIIEIEGKAMSSYIDWMRSCYYISVTGLPAISVPAGFTGEGLPIGLQIVGHYQNDGSVLQIAHAYEQARGSLSAPAIAADGTV